MSSGLLATPDQMIYNRMTNWQSLRHHLIFNCLEHFGMSLQSSRLGELTCNSTTGTHEVVEAVAGLAMMEAQLSGVSWY